MSGPNKVYYYCVVPKCINTSTNHPAKKLFSSPSDTKRRRTWPKMMRRDPTDLSQKTTFFVCEDHFDLEVDLKNFTAFKYGNYTKNALKPDAIPSIFQCQSEKCVEVLAEGKPQISSLQQSQKKVVEEVLSCTSLNEDTDVGVISSNYEGLNDGSKVTLPPDVDALPKVKTTYIPIIPDISHQEAMDKLKQLWTKQMEYLKTVKKAADEEKNVTGYEIRQFEWIYNDTEERIEKQIQVLSDVPWKENDDMKEALGSSILFYQKKSWDAMERCLNDHYEFLPKDQLERNFRKTLELARSDLEQRGKEIELIVNKKTSPAQS